MQNLVDKGGKAVNKTEVETMRSRGGRPAGRGQRPGWRLGLALSCGSVTE